MIHGFLRQFGLVFIVAVFMMSCVSDNKSKTLKVAINAGPEGEAVRILAQEYSDNKIEVIALPYSTLREQLMTTLSTKKSDFDIVMVDDPWLPQLAKNLRELQNVPDSLLSDFVTSSLNLCRYPYKSGELFALPLVGNTQLLFLRKDILDSLEIKDIPNNWKNLALLASSISENNKKNDLYGYAIRGRSGAPIVTDFLPIYWSLGGQLVDDVGNPKRESINPKIYIEALKIYKKLKDSSPPGASNFDWSEMTSSFTNGQSVFQLNWPAGIPLIDSSIVKQTGKSDWEIKLPPGNNDLNGTSMIGNWLLSIPKTSNNAEDAERFIVWVMQSQDKVASAGNPPTRISVFNKLAEQPDKSYFITILKALENSTPRVRSIHWSKIEEVISLSVSKYIIENITEEEALNIVKSEINNVFQRD